MPWLRRLVIGGAAMPEMILRAFEDDFEVEVIHAWGMTETSPLGSVCGIPPQLAGADRSVQLAQKMKQGSAPFGIEMKLTDDDHRELPHDGKAAGHLLVRGAAVASAYYRGEGDILDADGFFDTGDIATIDQYGAMQITDRAKDVIKSGGEWISSI